MGTKNTRARCCTFVDPKANKVANHPAGPQELARCYSYSRSGTARLDVGGHGDSVGKKLCAIHCCYLLLLYQPRSNELAGVGLEIHPREKIWGQLLTQKNGEGPDERERQQVAAQSIHRCKARACLPAGEDEGNRSFQVRMDLHLQYQPKVCAGGERPGDR